VKNPANYERLTRPVCAFVTFESDDGQAEAINYTKRLRYNKHRNQREEGFVAEQLLGADPQFIPATEPTNIIWEHRHIKGINYCARVLTATLIITVMLVISFAVIIAFKQTSIYFKSEFPAVNCSQVEKRHTEDQLMQVAGFEYLDSMHTNWESPLNGAL
jgi:hypothetical protein